MSGNLYFCKPKSKAMQMVNLHNQYLKIKDEVDSAWAEVIESGAFIRGAAVREFEENLAHYLGGAKVVTCGNGTDALQIALMTLGLHPGDEVITTPFTFIATAEVIALLGLKPVFVDVDGQTFNMDVTQVEKAITSRTKVIMPVHLFGQCAEMEPLLEIARSHNLYVVEDACQAIGAAYTFSDGTVSMAGTMGTLGCTSFFPSKNLGCFGDGGALFTHDENLATVAASIANHGSVQKYHHERIGLNSRLDTLQAAVLNVKLRHLEEYTQARQAAAVKYDQLLAGCDQLTVPQVASRSTHVYHQYTVRLADNVNRAQVQQELKAAGIPSMVYYPVPLHLQPAFAFLGHQRGDFPVAEHLADTVLSLPMHTELTDELQEKVAKALLAAVNKG